MQPLQDALLRAGLPGAALESRPRQALQRGGGAEQYHANTRYTEAVAAAEDAADDDVTIVEPPAPAAAS